MENNISHSLSDLQTHLGYWLRLVSNHVSGSFTQALQVRQVTVAEWVTLRQLYDHPNITAAQLAVLLGMTKGAISKILVKLETKNFVERTIQMDDKRRQTLLLTSEGKQILPDLADLADKNDAYFFDCLDVQEKMQLRNLLQTLAEKHQWSDVPLE